MSHVQGPGLETGEVGVSVTHQPSPGVHPITEILPNSHFVSTTGGGWQAITRDLTPGCDPEIPAQPILHGRKASCHSAATLIQ